MCSRIILINTCLCFWTNNYRVGYENNHCLIVTFRTYDYENMNICLKQVNSFRSNLFVCLICQIMLYQRASVYIHNHALNFAESIIYVCIKFNK